MLNTPAFKSSYTPEIVDREHVLLLNERGNRILSGSLYVTVAGLLGEGRSVDDIIDAAAPQASAAEVFYALEMLEQMGVIREARNGMPRPALAFWDSVDVDPEAAARRLGEARVVLMALGDVPAASLANSLGSAGVTVADEGDLRIVLVDDYLRDDLAALNTQFLREAKPWMLARPVGSALWVGPLFRPGEGACWECLAQRMRGHRLAEAFVQTRKGYSHARLVATDSVPVTELTAAALIATEVAKWFAGVPDSGLATSLLTFDLTTMATERHTVTQRPQCPACGVSNGHDPEAVRLVSRMKRVSTDGGHRSESPEETLARYGHLVSRFTGVVRELTKAQGLDAGAAHVYYSGPNAATRDDTIESLRSRFRSLSGGKGKTEVQAKASALCEAIERYSGVFQGDEQRIRGSFESLGEAAIHPNACMLFSETQYATRRETPTGRYGRVPAPLDPRAEIEWSPLWSFTEERFKYLPTAWLYYDYPLPHDQHFCWADSNGCAAGASIEEAILQGFFELVERDSVALWWYNRVTRPGVDLDSFQDPYFDAVKRFYHSLGRELWVLDLTNDLGVPAFAAMSRRTEGFENIVIGFGAHLDPSIGILRAVTEANQMLPVALGRDDAYESPDAATAAWLASATVFNHPFLLPSPDVPARRPQDYPNLQQDDMKNEVEACVRIAASRGMETLVLDQTRKDIALPVVKVVVPGLRHFWRRFGPGRLYDIPVFLGWLPAPLKEEELNPLPMFF